MKKKENIINIENYSDYAILTYTPSFLKTFKDRVKISDAVVTIQIDAFDHSISKYSVEVLKNDVPEYLVDEFTLLENQTSVHINVTDELQQWIYSGDTSIKFKITGVSLKSDGNEIVFDYSNIKSFKGTKSTQEIDIKRAGKLKLNLITGNFDLSHLSLKCNSNALPIDIVNTYESINYDKSKDYVILENGKKDLPYFGMGNGWRTNFHQYLIKEKEDSLFGDSETSGKITYVDGYGNHTIFEEKYYYIKNDKKIYVHPSEVTINMDKTLSISVNYQNYDIYREARYKNLTLSGVVDDFKRSEYVQKEIDEIVQLKEEIKNIEKNISEYNYSITYNNYLKHTADVLKTVNGHNSTIQELSLQNELIDINLQLNSIDDQKDYDSKQDIYNQAADARLQEDISNIDDTTYKNLMNAERTARNNLEEKRKDMSINNQAEMWGYTIDENGKIVLSDGQSSGVLHNRKLIHEESIKMKPWYDHYNSDSYYNQIDKIDHDNTTLNAQIDELNIILTQKKYQLETLEKQIPVYMVYDENGNILGFSKTDDDKLFRLTLISDSYDNIICINYKNDQIQNVVDKENHTITFLYNEKGLLTKIVDFNSNFVEFEYIEDSAGKSNLLSNIKYQDGTESKYYYDANNNLIYAISPSGYGCYLEYETSRVVKISEITCSKNIDKTGIDIVDVGDLIPNTNIKYLTKGGLEVAYYDYKSTIVTDLLTNKNISYLFDKNGEIVTMCDNEFENGSIIGNVNVKSYDRDNDGKIFIIQSLPYTKNFLEGSNFNNSIISECVLGEDILCGDEVYLTSYVQEEGNGVTNSVFLLNNNNPTISKTVKEEFVEEINRCKIFDLILSGWAKADSAWVDRKCTGYNLETNNEQNNSDYFHNLITEDNDSFRNERRFELKAKLVYTHYISETESEECTEDQYCSFDWMNTKWQYCAFPITIKNDSSYTLKAIEVFFDYSNNTGEAQISNIELRKGNWEYYESDEDGKIIYYENSDTDNKIFYEYQDNKLAKEVISTNNKEYVIKYNYNNRGSLIRKISYDGIIEENVYNDKGKITQSYSYNINDPTNKIYTKNLTLDENGKVLSSLDESGNKVVEYKYKENSNVVIKTRDVYGNETNFGYSVDDRLLNSISVNVSGRNNYNRSNYNCDLLTGLSHNNCEYGFTYDGCGNVIETKINDLVLCSINVENITSPQLQESGVYKDVLVGTKTIKTLANGEIFVIYKNINGVTYRIEYYEDSDADGEIVLNNQIDLVGNVVISNDELNKITYTFNYTEDGNIETTSYTQNGKNILVTNTNMDDYNATRKVTINGETREELYVYSDGPESCLQEIHLSNGSIVGLTLDELKRLKSINVDGNGRTFEYLQKGNGATGLITDEWYSKEVEGVSVRTENLNYKYDAKGNIVEIRENGNLKAVYEYDSISRLIREDNYDFKETYLNEYDSGGNIINRRVLPLTNEETSKIRDGEIVEYLYRDDVWKDQLMSYNGEFFKYDIMGNPIIYRNNTLKWIRGSLLDTYVDSVNNKIYKYEYNADGLRISKNVDNKKTNFYLDGTRIIAQDDGNLLYFHYGVDGVVGFTYEGVGEYFYKKNIQGDIVGIYDNAGVQFTRYEYDAWGNHKIKVLLNGCYIDVNELGDVDDIVKNYVFIATLNPFRYRGYYFDPETKLYWVSSRYYSPELCRWISPDSIDYLDSQSINGLNLYAYCTSDPVNKYDPSGHFGIGALIALVVASMLIGGTAQLVSNAMAGKRGSELWRGVPGAAIGTGINVLALCLAIPTGGASLFIAAGISAMAQTGVDTLETLIRGEDVAVGQTFIDLGLNFITTLIGNYLGSKIIPTNPGWFQTKHFWSVFTRPYGQKILVQTLIGGGLSAIINFVKKNDWSKFNPVIPVPMLPNYIR